MRKLFVIVAALSAACGGEPDTKGDGAVVIVSVNNDNNMSMTTGMNNEEPPDCCGGRECGAAPGCEASCGTCADGAFCDEGGTCTEAAADAPRIIDFATNIGSMTPDDIAVFSAIVTDPDGIEDVIGGTLKAPSGASYGAFQTASAEGSYELQLDWNALNSVQPILFDESVDRAFVAEFYDQAGNKVQADVNITLRCSEPTGAACEPGVCSDTATSTTHCGGCGNDISEVYSAQCEAGQPACRSGQEFCTSQNICAFADSPQACGGVCGNDCARLAPMVNVTLDGMSNIVTCDGGECRIRFSSQNPAPCSEQCGPLRCVSGSASYEDSGLSAGCDQRWDDADRIEDYGAFLSANCGCAE